MSKLSSSYNQNRQMVWLIIVIVVAIIALIHIINGFVLEENGSQNTIAQEKNEVIIDNKNYSVITQTTVKTDVSSTIDEFISYCNNGEIENAYNLLSDECKEILYPSIEDFTNKYFQKLFAEKQTYTYQAWITNNGSYTYKVDFFEDMLATGQASTSSITDYYTVVVEQNGQYKLNINKFIGIDEINKLETKNDITLIISRKRIYMNYETYEIEINNYSENEIMLDRLQEPKTVYVENEKEQKYYWYGHEIIEEDVTVSRMQKQKIEVKINKPYKTKNQTIKIVFSNIMLNENNTMEMSVVL